MAESLDDEFFYQIMDEDKCEILEDICKEIAVFYNHLNLKYNDSLSYQELASIPTALTLKALYQSLKEQPELLTSVDDLERSFFISARSMARFLHQHFKYAGEK